MSRKLNKRIVSQRRVYDRNYYKAQIMLRDPWFMEKADWLRNRFIEINCPIPKKPFKSYAAYLDWNTKFWNRYSEMERSPEFLEVKRRITGGKEAMSVEELYALEDFREEFLPPVYGKTFDEMLEHFGIDRRDKGFRDFLELYFFFGQTEYPTTLFEITWRRNEKTNEMELFLRIYGHTKKEDIMNHWDGVAQEQRYMKDFIGKSKAWETFERDVEVYRCYKKLKGEGVRRRDKFWATDTQIWGELNKKYPELTLGNIRQIVSQTAKRIGEI